MQKIINVGFKGQVYILIEVQIDFLNLGTDLDLLVDFPREWKIDMDWMCILWYSTQI